MQFKLTQFMVTAIFASAAMVQAYPAGTVSAREDSPSPDALPDTTSAASAEGAGASDEGNGDANTTPIGVITPVIDDKLPDSTVATLWASGDAAHHGKAGAITESTGGCFTVPADWNDSITSIHVNPGFQCVFYIHAGCSGYSGMVQGAESGVTLQGTGFEKKISSYGCFADLRS